VEKARQYPALIAAILLVSALGGDANAGPGIRPIVVIRDVAFRLPDERTRQAFRIAFGRTGHALIRRERLDLDFVPIALTDLGGGRTALISTGTWVEHGHSSTGLNALHYFIHENGRVRITGSWFGFGADGSHGQAAMRWGMVRGLSRWPVLYTEGGGTWQGCTVSGATLTELRPAGPVDVASFPVLYSDAGMVAGHSAGNIRGVLAGVVPDRSFTVRYAGTMRFGETYVRVGDRYRLRGRQVSKVPGC
jgi:hypothetical protein